MSRDVISEAGEVQRLDAYQRSVDSERGERFSCVSREGSGSEEVNLPDTIFSYWLQSDSSEFVERQKAGGEEAMMKKSKKGKKKPCPRK